MRDNSYIVCKLYIRELLQCNSNSVLYQQFTRAQIKHSPRSVRHLPLVLEDSWIYLLTCCVQQFTADCWLLTAAQLWCWRQTRPALCWICAGVDRYSATDIKGKHVGSFGSSRKLYHCCKRSNYSILSKKLAAKFRFGPTEQVVSCTSGCTGHIAKYSSGSTDEILSCSSESTGHIANYSSDRTDQILSCSYGSIDNFSYSILNAVWLWFRCAAPDMSETVILLFCLMRNVQHLCWELWSDYKWQRIVRAFIKMISFFAHFFFLRTETKQQVSLWRGKIPEVSSHTFEERDGFGTNLLWLDCS